MLHLQSSGSEGPTVTCYPASPRRKRADRTRAPSRASGFVHPPNSADPDGFANEGMGHFSPSPLPATSDRFGSTAVDFTVERGWLGPVERRHSHRNSAPAKWLFLRHRHRGAKILIREPDTRVIISPMWLILDRFKDIITNGLDLLSFILVTPEVFRYVRPALEWPILPALLVAALSFVNITILVGQPTYWMLSVGPTRIYQ